MRKIVISFIAAIAVYQAAAQHQEIVSVLEAVEQNNAGLAAARKLRDARTIEARIGNSLENPEVEYIHGWGNPSSIGKQGELTLTQSFDFPTVYARRAEIARISAEIYGYEYAVLRQQTLLEAYETCLEIIALRQKEQLQLWALGNAERIVSFTESRIEAGDAGRIDRIKSRHEYLTALNDYRLTEAALSSAEERLRGMNGGSDTGFSSDRFPDISDSRQSLTDIISRYNQSSPDMLTALSETQAAAAEVRLSRNMSLPKLTAGYRYDFGTGERFNGVVVGMSIPMFGNRNNVKRARAEAEYSEASAEKIRQDIENDLRELYYRAEILKKTLDEFDALENPAETAETLQRAVSEGYISITEYFSQIEPLIEIMIDVIDLRREYSTAIARLYMIDL